MASNLYTSELMVQAVNLIRTDEPIGGGNVGLVLAQEGDLSQLNLDLDLDTLVPAVFVRPQEGQMEFEASDLVVGFYDITYFFRILLLDTFDTTDNVLQAQLEKSKYIADVFMRDVSRFTNPHAEANVLYSLLTSVDYDPPEKEELSRIGVNQVWVTAFTLEIRVNQARQT